ncbi:hypothetical protein [Methylorubrum sp. DB1722]|uniref:hypothetical protein n=1 Tax=Methylorubrum sp. DB1722 TaxID=2478916 RepID=UPI0018E32C15|nr:hypothetical protein [Methylorubrum sp. DB1722]MBI1689536.1 hypothetical protein [Methylorubrum sp. DB1722]
MTRICNLILLDDAQEELTEEHLYDADHEDGILSARKLTERGVTPSFEIKMAHPGWALFAPENKRAAALVTHEGSLDTATVHARGWIRNLPAAVTGSELTLVFECRDDDDDDLDDRREAAAQAVVRADRGRSPFAFGGDGSAQAAPYRDLLFSRLQKVYDEVLLGRSAWWRYDAVTHELTLVEDRAPARARHNIGDGYDPESLQISEGQGAVSEVRLRVIAGVTQSAQGTCNLAPILDNITSLMGYQASAPASLGSNAGWSWGTIETIPIKGHTRWFPSGRSWKYTNRSIRWIPRTTSTGATVYDTLYGQTFTYDTDEEYQLEQVSHEFTRFDAKYNYNQVRRDILDLVMEVPCQQAGGIRRVLDLGELNVQSLYTPVLDDVKDQDDDEDEPEEPPAEMKDGEAYKAGALAYYGGRLYRARIADPGPLYVVQNKRGKLSTVVSGNWLDTGIVAPVQDRTQSAFWTTPRGRAAATHAGRRMAKAAIARLYAWTATFTVEREHLPDVTIEDEILLLVPGHWDEPMKPMLGEVTKLEEVWDGEAGDTVTVTVKVAVGTGLDDEADVMRVGGFAVEGFDPAGFEVQTPQTTDSDLVTVAMSFPPVDERVDVRRLTDPTYVLRNVWYRGSADEQLAECIARGEEGEEAAPGNLNTPTSITMQMVPLVSESLIERKGTGTVTLHYSPRGLDLSE